MFLGTENRNIQGKPLTTALVPWPYKHNRQTAYFKPQTWLDELEWVGADRLALVLVDPKDVPAAMILALL